MLLVGWGGESKLTAYDLQFLGWGGDQLRMTWKALGGGLSYAKSYALTRMS